MSYKHIYMTWPSAGSPAFRGLESLVLRCGIFLNFIPFCGCNVPLEYLLCLMDSSIPKALYFTFDQYCVYIPIQSVNCTIYEIIIKVGTPTHCLTRNWVYISPDPSSNPGRNKMKLKYLESKAWFPLRQFRPRQRPILS